MVIVDTSVLFALFDTDEPDHAKVGNLLARDVGPLVVSPYVVAELDHLMTSRIGARGELLGLRELNGGAWDLAGFGREELTAAIALIEKYPDQNIGFTDASIVVLAKRFGTKTVATLDRRHFDVLRPLDGGRFTIVP
ncbi:MAG TPA: PIN domain-containing protein [Sporichthyaceae bacterium]|nr:PIN domain-containing protein [Sporichthyaceae bacterium]